VRSLPGGQSESTQYLFVPQANGNILRVKHSDFKAKVTTIDYDVMGRIVLETPDPSLPPLANVAIGFTYDPATGKRAQMTDASGITTYVYDKLGRLTKKSHTMANSTVLDDLSYTYDGEGNVLSINSSRAGGVSLTYHWDPLNRLIQVDDNNNLNNKSTIYDYDKVGNLEDIVYPIVRQSSAAPVTTSYSYNNLNRMTHMSAALGGTSPSTLSIFDYNPDPINPQRSLGPTGNRRVAVETISGISREAQYSYDSLYRLTMENIANDSDITRSTGVIDYRNLGGGNNGYDKVGNRQSRVVGLTPPIGGFVTVNSTFDADDRLASSTYDADGNTLVETLPALPTLPTPISSTISSPDQFDFENRLVQRSDGTHTISIVYDGDGNRVSKTINGITTYFLVDDQNPSGNPQVLEELTPSGGGALQVNRVYNYGLSLISEQQGTALSYYGYDGHGNVRFLMDPNGNITDTYTYDAFGVLIARSTSGGTSTPNNHLYCGEEYDPELGLYYLRSRYLNPTDGRFWTMDSYEGEGAVPASLHKYLYCGDDAVNNSDPSGNGKGHHIFVQQLWSTEDGRHPLYKFKDEVKEFFDKEVIAAAEHDFSSHSYYNSQVYNLTRQWLKKNGLKESETLTMKLPQAKELLKFIQKDAFVKGFNKAVPGGPKAVTLWVAKKGAKLLPPELVGRAERGAVAHAIRVGWLKKIAKKGTGPFLSIGFTVLMAERMHAAGATDKEITEAVENDILWNVPEITKAAVDAAWQEAAGVAQEARTGAFSYLDFDFDEIGNSQDSYEHIINNINEVHIPRADFLTPFAP
jgi:RHS repeat-associated protein